MFLEIWLALAVAIVVALVWHGYHQPERVLERFARALAVPDYLFLDRNPVPGLRLAIRERLEDRYMRLCAVVRDGLYDLVPHGEPWAQAHERIARMLLHDPSADALDDLRDAYFLDLQNRAMANGTPEQYLALEDELIQLAADIRFFRKLERALHVRR